MLIRANRSSLVSYRQPQRWCTALSHTVWIPNDRARWKRRLSAWAPTSAQQAKSRILQGHGDLGADGGRALSTCPDFLSGPDARISMMTARKISDGVQYPSTMALPGFMPLWDLSPGTQLPQRDQLLGQNMDDSIKNLHACLTVGRFDRGEGILRRLAGLPLFKVTEVQEINNTFLRSLVHAVFRGGNEAALKKLHTWFELEMRQLGISPDATTLALMCRSAFVLASDKTRDRTIRRYLFIAEEMNLLESTLSSGEYLSDEFNAICSIRDDIFRQIPQENPTTSTSSSSSSSLPASSTSASPPSNWVCPTSTTAPAASSAPTPALACSSAYASPSERPPVNLSQASQKGMGMTTLLQGLRSLYDGDTVTKQPTDEQRINWQISLEEDILQAELQRWRAEHAEMNKRGINPAMSSRSMGGLLWTWQVALKDEISKHLAKIQSSTSAYMTGDGPYLEQIGPDKAAAITILESLKTLSMEGVGNGANVYSITGNIGDALELESWLINQNDRKAGRLKQSNQARRLRLLRRMQKNASQVAIAEEADKSPGPIAQQNELLTRERRSVQWPKVAKLRAAAFLLSKLIQVSKFTDKDGDGGGSGSASTSSSTSQPPLAFSHATLHKRGRRFGIIQVHPGFAKRLTKDPPTANLAHQLPMIAQPEPWTDFRGAYLRYPAALMRIRDPSGISDLYIDASIQEGNLDKVFQGLNILGKTEWRINRPIFDIMAQVWNTGEALTNFPPANPRLDLPPEPAESAEPAAKYRWRKEVKRLRDEHSGFHSNRCFLNLQMEVARAFLGHTFYLPHNMDFRGRAYPVGGIFQHMGADNARGLFQFAKGKALGATGLNWLKVHLANTFGFDKASLADRANFADQHLDQIRDSVNQPLGGKRWWMEAEDPWQFLACCHDLLSALDSPDPSRFISHLPVHQDGTCNGLQHYAALGGDELGATQVNLVCRDKPADIYSEVARLVQQDIEQDEAAGNPMAKVLHGYISRKVVKQPVMTYAYGVTFYGARHQIQNRLDEIISPSPTNQFSNQQLALYITVKVFKHFGTLFQGATEIQHWLAECAGRISTALSPEQIENLQDMSLGEQKDPSPNSTTKRPIDPTSRFQSGVVWTTPLKLPVVQPYRVIDAKKDLITSMQAFKLVCPSSSDTVHRRKQMAGFPPNFIHSLDATHMLLSALRCDEANLTFAMVHDSFWTHAADVPTMSKALRETFVQIHSEDIIGRLAEEFNARYHAYLWRKEIPSACPLAKRITALRQTWRMDMWRGTTGKRKSIKDRIALYELLQERDRFRLLSSNDETERQRGREMVTPGSMFAELHPDHPDLLPPNQPSPSPQLEQTFQEKNEIHSLDDVEEPERILHPTDTTTTDYPHASYHTASDLDHDPQICTEGYEDEVSLEPESFAQQNHLISITTLASSRSPPTTSHSASAKPVIEDAPSSAFSAHSLTSDSAPPTSSPHLGSDSAGKTKKAVTRYPKPVKLWVSLTFPALPQKGTFDVRKVMDSTYFFS